MVWLAALLFAQGPDLDREVHLRTPGQSLPSLLKGISDETKIPISAVGSLAKNTLVVRLDRQPLRSVLDQLGKGLTCSWRVVEGQRIELYRTEAQTTQLRNTERALRSAELKKSIEALELEEFSKAYGETLAQRARNLEPRLGMNMRDPVVTAEVKALFAAMPSGRGLARVAKSLPLDRLLQMTATDRVVFAYPANSQQVSLPQGRGILEAFNSERSTMFDVLKEDLVRESEFSAAGLDSRGRQFRLMTPATKVIGALSRSPGIRGFYLKVSFVNADGWTVAELSQLLNEEPKADLPELSDVTAEVTDDSYRLAEAMSYWGWTKPKPLELRQTVANPVRYEPLSWYHGSVLFDHSERSKRPLVGVLTDRSLRRVWMSQTAPGQSVPAKQLAFRMAKEWTLNSQVEGGTWFVRPLEQLASEREYLDRDLMATAWASLLKERRYLISEAAAYNARAQSELLGAFSEISFVIAVAPPDSDTAVDKDLTDPTVLRFVGRLPGNFLAAEGRDIAVGELPANAREALDRWLLKSAYVAALGYTTSKDHPFPNVKESEPTEALPRGIPSDTRIRLSWVTAYFVMWQRIPNQPFMFAPAESVYYMLQWNNQNAHYDSASGRALQVEVHFADGRKVTHVIRETPDYMTTERNWRKLSELPNEVLEVMRAEDRRQEALGNRGNVGSGPPPTR